jgi:hypothetical protein
MYLERQKGIKEIILKEKRLLRIMKIVLQAFFLLFKNNINQLQSFFLGPSLLKRALKNYL